jgi:hypothetical protein
MDGVNDMTITGIKAGLMEAKGDGAFHQKGKLIEFRDNRGLLVASWWAATSKDAAQQIRLFRAAPKYLVV